MKPEVWLAWHILVAWLFCLPGTLVGPLNTETFWEGKSNTRQNIVAQSKKANQIQKYLHLQCNKDVDVSELVYLKSEGVMAWEASFSKIRVTGRCNGWFGASNMLRQWARSVETSPPSHTICRFRSDLTMAWMWSASESWTSIESWERRKEHMAHTGALTCI